MAAPSARDQGPEHARAREQAEGRVGTVLRGKYRLDSLLDVGGMSAVYAATHRNGARAAIKLLHRALSEHEDVRERFLREGYAANKVGHPGAVQITDDEVAEDGAVFLVMELLEGESLDARLRRLGPLAAFEVLAFAAPVLDVLASAHGQGIVHRDVKPGNVFLARDGRVKLLDFGLARVREGTFEQRRTRDGVVMGTIGYLAPEQARGLSTEIDARTDLWALGATMFTVLSGRHVHEGGTPMDRVITAASVPARSLATVVPHAPPQLVAIVDKALAFKKDERFPSADAMRHAVLAATHALEQSLLRTADEAPPIDLDFGGESSSPSVMLVEDDPGMSFIDAVIGHGRR